MQQVNNWFCSCKPAPDLWANTTLTGELFNHGFLSTLSSTEIRWPNQLGAEQECDGQEERTSERILVNHTADQMLPPSHRDLMIVWQRGEKNVTNTNFLPSKPWSENKTPWQERRETKVCVELKIFAQTILQQTPSFPEKSVSHWIKFHCKKPPWSTPREACLFFYIYIFKNIALSKTAITDLWQKSLHAFH